MATPTPAGAPAPARQHYLDWLRNLVVLFLIPFHTARIFNFDDPFYVKNGDLSRGLSMFVDALSPWAMELLFLVSGAAAWYALGARSGGQFRGERLRRLLVPLVFGLLVLVPPQAYLASFQVPGYNASYWEFYPQYFRLAGDLSGYTGQITPAHLWFVLYLLLFALIASPLFRALRGAAGRRFVDWLARLCERPGVILALFLPSALVLIATGQGGAPNPFYFFTIYLLGYLLVMDERIMRGVDRHLWPALLIGVVAMALDRFGLGEALALPSGGPAAFVLGFVPMLNMWCWVLVLIAAARRYLNSDSALLRYVNEAAYPYYILHQTAIVAIGFVVVRWQAGVPLKYAAIALASFATTVLAYELLIRPWNAMRFLFGMKPLVRAAPVRLAPR